MPRFRILLLAVLGLVLLGGVATWVAFDGDMRAARAAIAGRSTIAETDRGAIEYAETGAGTPLLTIHGAGGGFDQGLANAAAMIGPGFRLISPSRFGYLRTPVPEDASPAAQADAHAALLDHLGIDRVVVLGVSAGSRSALELALRHRQRVAALILVVPALYYPGMAEREAESSADYPLLLRLVNSGADFAWWTLAHLAPDALVAFVGVPPAVLHAADAAEQASVMQIVRSIEPLSARFAGISIDSRPDRVQRPLATIDVPTLLITARDDLFDTHPSAAHAAAQIPGARLVVFEAGGHLLVGHGEAVRRVTGGFLAGAIAP